MTGMLTYAMDMRGKIGFGSYGGYSMMNTKGVNEWYDVMEGRVELIGGRKAQK